MPSYKLYKHCPICNKLLQDKNKTGFCNKHRPRSGENNPFFGKHHSQETLKQIKIHTSEATKQKWKDDKYRENVITGMTGKTRNDEFKETQRKNAINQFKDNSQRELRSNQMKQSWAEGKIVRTKHTSYNKSKGEKEMIKILSEYFDVKSEETIEYNDGLKTRWLFPDCVIGNTIIEYNGSYWHADPTLYNPSDIIHHNKTAQEIWDEDARKKQIYEQLGYSIIYIWSNRLKNDPEYINEIIKEIQDKLNTNKSL